MHLSVSLIGCYEEINLHYKLVNDGKTLYADWDLGDIEGMENISTPSVKDKYWTANISLVAYRSLHMINFLVI